MPLPPYIKEQLRRQERYQTVYAKELVQRQHQQQDFILQKNCLDEIKAKGCTYCFYYTSCWTWNISTSQCRYILKNMKCMQNFINVQKKQLQLLNDVRANGGRIITVGTTSTRTLETIATEHDGKFVAASGWTNIFIYPGYEFKAIDGMITNSIYQNQHLIMLVSALAGQRKCITCI